MSKFVEITTADGTETVNALTHWSFAKLRTKLAHRKLSASWNEALTYGGVYANQFPFYVAK